MATEESHERVQRLVEGFGALTEEYQRIWLKSQALERNLRLAKSEVCHPFHLVLSALPL